MKVNGAPLTDTSVTVTWSPPKNTNGADVFYSYANESQKNYCKSGKDQNTCVIDNLAAYTAYHICVVTCPRHYGTIIEPSTAFNEASNKIVDSTYFDINQISIQSSEGVTDNGHFCSIPTCGAVHTFPSGTLPTADPFFQSPLYSCQPGSY